MPDLPRGTVTLLFSDVEGSTRLLERLGARYAGLLEDCRRLQRAAFEEVGGREVDQQGDALFVAFGGAADAVTGARAAQVALAAHAWPEGAECRVRMGVHTGEPAAVADGYVGMDVHVGARICAAAHGGQVLVSAATARLLPDPLELRELGEHRLKDVPQPVRLYELPIPGVERDFPPPRTLNVTNLPAPATPLVGRARELDDVTGLLLRDHVRLVTLTGAGGAGKTRLALEAALGLLDRYEGVFFVSFASIDRPAQVLPAVARAVGVPERPGEPVDATLARELRDRRILLVLDNLERVVEAADAIASLLARCPRVDALATSRERLHVLAEHEYPVAPLPAADAVRLFEERARAVSGDVALTDEQRATVADVCRRLDGLPLAIELAASFARLLPPEEILARLESRLSFLTGGPRDLPERHRTLRATMDWSYGSLSDAEQRLFAELAVFANGFTIDAAEAVWQSENGLASLASLRDKNLVAPQQSADERPRFLMLDTVREYALERLEDGGGVERARTRHADHFVRLAEAAEAKLTGAEQARWFRLLEEEHENLQGALSWGRTRPETGTLVRLAGSLWRFWFVRGHLTVARGWLNEGLPAPAEAAARAKVLYGASIIAAMQGDLALARPLAEERLELCRELADPASTLSALVALANIVSDEGDLDRAVALYEEAAELARAEGTTAALAATTANLGYLALRVADWQRAESLSREAAELFRDADNATGIADALLNRGYADLRLGRRDEALACLAEGLRTYAELGHREGVVNALEGLAAASADAGEPEEAAVLLGAAEALRNAVGARLEPLEQELHDATIAAVAERVPRDVLDAQLARGAALRLEEAVAEGLRTVSPRRAPGRSRAGRTGAGPRATPPRRRA